jgi:hypothetical protein
MKSWGFDIRAAASIRVPVARRGAVTFGLDMSFSFT